MTDKQERMQKPLYKSIKEFANSENPWEHDFKFQYENFNSALFWNLDDKEDSPIIRLLKYKMERIDGNKVNLPFDCDGSGEGEEKYVCWLTREIYRTLWDWQDKIGQNETKRLVRRYGYIGTNGWLAGPDTMNSFFTVFESYLKLLRGEKYSAKTLYSQLVMPQDKMERSFDEFVPDENDRKEWEKYAKLHHCIGNFILVPAGFNTFRAGQFSDFWDVSLFYLKRELGNSWLQCDDIFTKYINYFFLWDYVKYDSSQYQVRSLRKSGFKEDEAEIISDDESPSLKVDETSQFLDNAMWAIERRGKFMTAMLRLQKIDCKAYERIRHDVFAQGTPYEGYSGVKKKLGKLPPDVEEVLEGLS